MPRGFSESSPCRFSSTAKRHWLYVFTFITRDIEHCSGILILHNHTSDQWRSDGPGHPTGIHKVCVWGGGDTL